MKIKLSWPQILLFVLFFSSLIALLAMWGNWPVICFLLFVYALIALLSGHPGEGRNVGWGGRR